MLRFARGRVLDVGCAAGRVALALQERGREVVAIDESPLAVEVARRRGVRDARALALADVDASLGTFDAVLIVRNNFGLGGPDGARALLERIAAVTTPRGRLITDSVDPHRIDDEDIRAGTVAGGCRLVRPAAAGAARALRVAVVPLRDDVAGRLRGTRRGLAVPDRADPRRRLAPLRRRAREAALSYRVRRGSARSAACSAASTSVVAVGGGQVPAAGRDQAHALLQHQRGEPPVPREVGAEVVAERGDAALVAEPGEEDAAGARPSRAGGRAGRRAARAPAGAAPRAAEPSVDRAGRAPAADTWRGRRRSRCRRRCRCRRASRGSCATSSITSARPPKALIGKPLPSAFATTVRSGRTPSRPWAPSSPTRNPVITSSNTSSAPCAVAERPQPLEVTRAPPG